MFIVKHKKIFISISIVLVVLSLLALAIFRLNIGIDFKGGALSEVRYATSRPAQADLNAPLEALEIGMVQLEPIDDLGYIAKTRDLTDTEHAALLNVLSQNDPSSLTEVSFNSIGPSIGRELTRKAILAIVLISLAIIAFIAFAFRKVSNRVASWKYGVIAVITLLHDVTIPVGIFVVLSHIYGIEVDALFVVAILTILGLSVSDTIVIFDRIRENLATDSKEEFSQIVGKSLEESYVRSISTSLTVILVLLALVFFGPVTTKYFALMLTAGMFFGTYSSIFLASPLLVWVQEWQTKKS